MNVHVDVHVFLGTKLSPIGWITRRLSTKVSRFKVVLAFTGRKSIKLRSLTWAYVLEDQFTPKKPSDEVIWGVLSHAQLLVKVTTY